MPILEGRHRAPAQSKTSPERSRPGSFLTLSDLAMPIPEDGPRAMRPTRQAHSASSDMVLSVAEDEPPTRIGRRSKGRGFLRAVLMLTLLGGAGAVIWHVLNGAETPPAESTAPAAPTPPKAATPVPAAPAVPSAAPATAAAPTPAAPAAAEEKKAEKEEACI